MARKLCSVARSLFLTACLSWVLTSCATMGVPSTWSYTAPTETTVVNSITLVKEPSKVWDELVEDLATTFYVINNIDKESRLLNVSFSETNAPSTYVDCGEATRTYEYKGDETRYEYPVSDSNAYKFTNGLTADTLFASMVRSTSLEGRANIYVAPNPTGGTIVTVNSRYIWKVSLTVTEMMYFGESAMLRPGFQPQTLPPITVGLNTNKPGFYEDPNGLGTIYCVGTGVFETAILDILR